MASTLVITGLDEAVAALKAMAVAVDKATAEATEMTTAMVEGRARANLARYSHSRGTPTPSPRGQPPAKISGVLQNSFEDTMPSPDGDGGWECELSSGLAYSLIQEVGGWAGRGHRSYLPPRPYLRPAVDDLVASGAIRDTYIRYWEKAILA